MDSGRTPTKLFSIACMVQGYHIYKDTWDALIGEELPCEREGANHADPLAAAIIKDDNIVCRPCAKDNSVLVISSSRRFNFVSCNWQ